MTDYRNVHAQELVTTAQALDACAKDDQTMSAQIRQLAQANAQVEKVQSTISRTAGVGTKTILPRR